MNPRNAIPMCFGLATSIDELQELSNGKLMYMVIIASCEKKLIESRYNQLPRMIGCDQVALG